MKLFTISEVRNMTPSHLKDLLNIQNAVIYELESRLDKIKKIADICGECDEQERYDKD